MSMKKKKIGIMGGTFNPIHNGHIALAKAAYEYCNLDEVWFMPSGISYQKNRSEIVSGEHRLKMTGLAIEEYPYFSCSDVEVRREGNTYTADTLRLLCDRYPEYAFFFIMGADSFLGLPHWQRPDEIAKLCTLTAVVRDDVDVTELKNQAEYVRKTLNAQVVLVPFKKVDISSSDIRNKLQNHDSVIGLLPDKVATYIRQNKLYSKE